jgi:aspartate kinase
MKAVVMKFGGASVATPDHFGQIADLIRQRKEDHHVVVVISAMAGETDKLISLAKQVNPNPPQREQDMLISVGERISISLLAMALAKEGIDAISFTGSQAGVITCLRHSEARIVEVRPHRLIPHLEKGKIVIVAGFQGVSRAGEITTLGRGGSDTSAVALGVALKAPVEFYKDVGGIYESDPKKDPAAKQLKSLSYEKALDIVTKGQHPVLHPRCIELARKNGVSLIVRSFQNHHVIGTTIPEEPMTFNNNLPQYEEE